MENENEKGHLMTGLGKVGSEKAQKDSRILVKPWLKWLQKGK